MFFVVSFASKFSNLSSIFKKIIIEQLKIKIN
jgi:hypothetical protein